MPDYKPLSLLQTRSYPGYQFYATMTYDSQPAEYCMRYVILTVMEWIRQRIGGDTFPPELQTPSAKEYAKIPNKMFKSYHFNGGFNLDITSLPDRGIWSMRIKEPDVERQGKKAIIGRFFVTDIGLRCQETMVECGIRTDVLDPMDVTQEVPNAYRPAFLRALFETKRLKIIQVERLKYNQANQVNNPMALKRLMDLIVNESNYMPIMVLTYASEQRKVMDVVDKLDRYLGLSESDRSFAKQLSQLDLVPETLEFGDTILPYDADYMAYHTFPSDE